MTRDDASEQRKAILSGTLATVGTGLLVIGAGVVILHVSPFALLGVMALAPTSFINMHKSGVNTVGEAVGKGVAMGVTLGATSIIFAETSQLLGHLSHNSDHTTPVHLSPDTPVHLSPDHTAPVHHSGDSSLTPKSDAQAPEDSKGALNLNTAHGGQSVLDSSAESIVQNAHGEQSVFNSSAKSIEKSAFIAKLENQFGMILT